MKSQPLKSVVLAASVAIANVFFVMPVLAQSRAALTRDIDRPAAQPVHGLCQSQYGTPCVLYTVPAGKRLVVQTVSYYVLTSDAAAVELISFGAYANDLRYANVDNSYAVTPALTTNAFGPRFLSWAGSQALTAYFEQGEAFAAALFSRTGSTTERYSFSGYLVDR